MSGEDKMLGALDSILFREPLGKLDKNWFRAIVGTFGGYRDFIIVAQSFRNAANYLGKIDRISFSFHYNGDWSKEECWIGYDNLRQDLTGVLMVSKNPNNQTGAK